MARFVTISGAACLLAFMIGCQGEDPVGPGENPPVEQPIKISYAADDGRAVSRSVTAAVGDELSATDNAGVSFTLIIPPRALPSDLTITMTPLASLSITGAGGDTCLSCDGGDCCHRGVLIEPSGVQLDSTATLVVRYPDGSGFPFDGAGLVVYVDSTTAAYESLPTQTDTLNHTLTASLRHFSGYGTDEPVRDRLRAEIQAKARLLDSLTRSDRFYLYIWQLERLHFLDGFEGPNGARYDDLVALLERLTLEIWSKQAGWELGRASGQTSCEALGRLATADANVAHCTGWHNGEAFAGLRASLRAELLAMMQRAAAEGRSLCERDACAAGQALLTCARECYIHSGFDDVDLITQINEALGNCCRDVAVTMSASRSTLRTHAFRRTSYEDCYAVLTVTVTGSDGEPRRDVWIDMRVAGDPSLSPGSGATDSLGQFRVGISAYFAPEPDCTGKAQRDFIALANVGGEEFLSEPVTIMFTYPTLTLDIDYSCSVIRGGDDWGHSTITINGSLDRLMGATSCSDACAGTVTRTYTASYWDGSGSMVEGQAEYRQCPFDFHLPAIEILPIPYGQRGVGVGYYPTIRLYPFPMFNFEIRTCSTEGDCNTGSVRYYISPAAGCGVVPDESFLYGVFVTADAAGEFPDLVFTQNWTEYTLGNTSLTMSWSVSW